MSRKLTAEFLGALWLILGGCGAAVLAAKFSDLGVGLTDVSFAFGLTVLTMACAIGHISGCHLNPAATFGLAAGGRIRAGEVPGYMLAQVLGACAGASILYLIASGEPGFSLEGGFAANGFAAYSPGKYGLGAAVTAEFVTAFFLLIILGAIVERAPEGLAPIAIGFGLTLIHLISIPTSKTSVIPARITDPAVFAGDWALAQLWQFWPAPLAGAACVWLLLNWLGAEDSAADRLRAVREAGEYLGEALAPATASERR